MYRIYCNTVALHLLEKSTWEKWSAEYSNHDAQQEIFWDESLEWAPLFEDWFQEKESKTVLVVFPDGSDMMERIMQECVILRAAGGIVQNDDHEWLLIFRRAHWDLPKGIIEKGENALEAALREVNEETSISSLAIKKPIMLYDNRQACTYHLYPYEGQWALKPTYWFLMQASGQQEVEVQHQEEIEKAAWVAPEQIDGYLAQAYPNIVDVIHTASGMVL